MPLAFALKVEATRSHNRILGRMTGNDDGEVVTMVGVESAKRSSLISLQNSKPSALFKQIDKDGSGTLDKNELQRGLECLGVMEYEISLLFRELDKNNDNKVLCAAHCGSFNWSCEKLNRLPESILFRQVTEDEFVSNFEEYTTRRTQRDEAMMRITSNHLAPLLSHL